MSLLHNQTLNIGQGSAVFSGRSCEQLKRRQRSRGFAGLDLGTRQNIPGHCIAWFLHITYSSKSQTLIKR